jgi:hypothetical protein
METHLVVRILLEYLGHLRHWTAARVLCHGTHDIVSARPYTDGVVGRRAGIRTNQCMACARHVGNPRWIRYEATPPAYWRYAVTCHHYHCQVSALFSMLRALRSDHIRVLKRPFQDTPHIHVPRSDGSATMGQAVVHGVIDIQGQPHVMTRWSTPDQNYTKNVPWSHYFDEPPQYVFPDVHTRTLQRCSENGWNE